MAYQITWTQRAKTSYEDNIAYLEKKWTEREIRNFVIAVEEKLQLIAIFPELFTRTNKRTHVRKTTINKHILLFYRPSKAHKRIELLLFWDSRQDPEKLKL